MSTTIHYSISKSRNREMQMLKEVLAGIGTITLPFLGWVIAQADPGTLPALNIPASVTGLITQAGGLGLAVWLVYHHTTVTIPGMQRLHAEERTAAQALFAKVLDEKREEYFREIERQREQFAAMIATIRCQYQQKP